MGPTLSMVRKEFLQLKRDRALLVIVLVVPIVQLLVLSYAINSDLRNVRVSILDEDHSPASRRLTEAVLVSDIFRPGPTPSGPADLERLLQEGRTDLALHIPPDFSREAFAGGRPQLALIVDGSNSSMAGRAAGYAQALLIREILRAQKEEMLPDNSLGRVSAEPRFFFNPALESRIYMVPGIMVMLVTIIAAVITGMAVVREKEIGTLEQVMVTPLSSLQFVVGKTLPFALIALVDLCVATVFAMAWFQVPFLGSPGVLLLGVIGYLGVTMGLGLLASAVSGTQQQSMFTVWFYLIFAVLLSGFFFPVENMPGWARTLTWINPMRFFMNIVRGVLLKGAGLGDLARDLAILAAMSVITLSAAVAGFRKTSA